jgi:hypothetical protein
MKTLNDRQVKALRAVKHNDSFIKQYTDSAAWYVWVSDPMYKDYKTRLTLTCKDVWEMGHLNYLSAANITNERFLTDEGRKYLEEIES